MRDEVADSVTPGGNPAPPGVRGAAAATGAAATDGDAAGDAPEAPRPSLGSPATHAAILGLSLLVYAALATAVVEGGWLVTLDQDLSSWVARSMPSVVEWPARFFTALGSDVGATAVALGVCVWLVTRRDFRAVLWLAAVGIGSQILVTTAKFGYDRPRPTAGSPIEVPDSFSFPSGHATTGAAVFGVFGLLVARHLASHRARTPVIAAGFALGALIAASRVVLNVHFLSDVLAGTALGLAWLAFCLLAPDVVAWGRRRYAARS